MKAKQRCIVARIPDVSHIRRELSRNARERDVLSRLLRLAERKERFEKLNRESEVSNV